MTARRKYGTLSDGRPVDLISVGHPESLQLNALTYGCIITSLLVPDADGRMGNVVLGFERLEHYIEASPYYGAVVGRYANRIAHARFAIDGREHHVSGNEPPHHLHGGVSGFDKRLWDAEVAANGTALVFRRTSPDGEEGYPGTVDVEVTYAVAERQLQVDYHAATDAPTHVNLTQHSYFNLRGSGDTLSHRLAINASTYLPVDETRIPTGECAPVANSPFDFQESTPLGLRLGSGHEQLRRAGGYDHNFNITRSGHGLAIAAFVLEPSSRRTLEVRTTEPGVQLYSGQAVGHRGFCLETQHYPDSPNRPEFPSTLLRPGQTFHSTTIFSFGIG